MSKSAFWQDPWSFHAHPATGLYRLCWVDQHWSFWGLTEITVLRGEDTAAPWCTFVFGHWEGGTAKVEVQKVGRGVPGEAHVKTGVPCESGEEGEGRGASQQGHARPPTILSPIWSPGVPTPWIQGYPWAHCWLYTAYHGFVWQLVWILSLQPKLMSDLKTRPTPNLRFDMNVKNQCLWRGGRSPGGAVMSLGTHAARGHCIRKPQGPRRGCPPSQANLENRDGETNKEAENPPWQSAVKKQNRTQCPLPHQARASLLLGERGFYFFVQRNEARTRGLLSLSATTMEMPACCSESPACHN